MLMISRTRCIVIWTASWRVISSKVMPKISRNRHVNVNLFDKGEIGWQ
jgi:hypothetical protein